jgi:LPXTG-motif cell wall-anchored protein
MSLWFIAAGLLASVALVVGWVRRRRDRPEIEPVTKQWLAEAASREDHVW